MHVIKNPFVSTAFIAIVVLAVLATLGIGTSAADLDTAQRQQRIRVDVAEDPSRFVFNGIHTIDDPESPAFGFGAYGDYFVTQGFIYPAGTLDIDDPGVECEFDDDGVPIQCDPLYEPIGQWTCYGVHVGEGAATETGNWVVTTQIFELERNGHIDTIVTDGFETPTVRVPINRAITGGTLRFSGAEGQHVLRTFGLHAEVFNIRSTNTFQLLG